MVEKLKELNNRTHLNHIYNIDALNGLKLLEKDSIDCVITSPPFWSLRDYGKQTNLIWDENKECKHEWTTYKRESNKWDNKPTTGTSGKMAIKGSSNYAFIPELKQAFCKKCGAWYGQLGLEPDFNLYIKHLCDIFDEVKRVLKKTGTCWVNIGDTYYTKSATPFRNDKISGDKSMITGLSAANSIRDLGLLPSKCLVGIPFRFAIEMINRGWILRNTIIWHKPNVIPSSAKDRFTVDFEYLFFFVKNRKYYFQQILEPYSPNTRLNEKYKGKSIKNYIDNKVQDASEVKRRILKSIQNREGRNKRTVWSITTKPFKKAHFATYPPDLVEIPIKAGSPKNGVVLDPFMGAGTTALVCKKLSRNYIGFELEKKYILISNNRLREEL